MAFGCSHTTQVDVTSQLFKTASFFACHTWLISQLLALKKRLRLLRCHRLCKAWHWASSVYYCLWSGTVSPVPVWRHLRERCSCASANRSSVHYGHPWHLGCWKDHRNKWSSSWSVSPAQGRPRIRWPRKGSSGRRSWPCTRLPQCWASPEGPWTGNIRRPPSRHHRNSAYIGHHLGLGMHDMNNGSAHTRAM